MRMKIVFCLVFSTVFLLSCSAQKTTVNEYDSFIKTDNYKLEMKKSGNTHKINYQRKVDSLSFEMEITPSLRDVFDNVSHLKENRLVIMSVVRIEDKLYKIEQINFINLDGRNTSIHNYSDDIFNIDLSKYQVRMIKCNNCTEKISFTIYSKTD